MMFTLLFAILCFCVTDTASTEINPYRPSLSLHDAPPISGRLVVALALRAVGDELQVPLVHLVQVGETALGKGAQQVQRRGRLIVGAHQALRIGLAGLLGEVDAVDNVAAIARQLDAVDYLGGRRARLGELAGHAANLQDRKSHAQGPPPPTPPP